LAQEHLVSIRQASQALGVSEAALRRWTDEGKIKAFITPGGHRRYSTTELRRLAGSRPRALGVKNLATELEGTIPLLRDVARKSLSGTSWYNSLSRESQESLAYLGRHLLHLIVRYITQPAKREETIRLVNEVGRGFGETLARLKLPLTDSVEAFLQHRDPIMKAATQLMKRRQAPTGRVVAAIPLVAHVMDQALVSLVAAHQQYQHSPQKRKGDATT